MSLTIKNMEGEPKKSYIEQVQEIIDQSPQEIEREFHGESGNTWLACVNSRLTGIMANLEFAIEDGEIDEERGSQANERLDALVVRVRELQKIYSSRDIEVPQEVKEEILHSINILK